MKKQLLGSTALVAAGMLAAAGSASAQQPTPGKITLQLGGYMTQMFGYSGNHDNTQPKNGLGANLNNNGSFVNWSQQSDAEFYLLGKTTLDNGITVGVNIEMEIVGSPGQAVDEQWLFVEGSFGQVRMGMEDQPSWLMAYTAPDAGLGLTYGWASYSFVPNPMTTQAASTRTGATPYSGADNTRQIVGGFDGPMNSTRMRMEDDDSNKIIYYSPRIEGFQFGASYTPIAFQDSINGVVAPGGRSSAYTEGWSLGLNFVRKFDPVDIAVSAGYQRWDHNPQIVTDFDPRAATPWGFNLGTNIGYAGFTIGASYNEIKDLRYSQVSLVTMNGGKSWDAGLQYDFGANSVSIGYFEGWEDGAVGSRGSAINAGGDPNIATYGHDRHQMYQVSAGHRFGPGVAVKASTGYVSWRDESNIFNNSGYFAAAGIFLNF